MEAQARDAQHQVAQHHHEVMEQLGQVDEQLKENYERLTHKHDILSLQELPQRKSELAFFEERTREMEMALERDPTRARAFRLREEIFRLDRLHKSLQAELDGPQLSEEEQREHLLGKVKADNAQITECERRLSEAQDAIRAGKKQLAKLANDVNEANDPKAIKIQELYQRDKEMSGVIDTFDEEKAASLAKVSTSQDEVVRLLQSISRKLAMQENTSDMSDEKLAEMKSDLNFKRDAMDQSLSTKDRIARELAQRKTELDKIETLDEKIGGELQMLEEKLKTMDEELVTFEDVPALRAQAAQQQAEALATKEQAEGTIGELKERAAQAKKAHDDLLAKLKADDVHTALEELEAKIKHQEQTVWVLNEYIEAKGAEAFFEPIAEDCLNMIQGVNAETITVLRERPAYNPAQFTPY